MSTDFPDAPIGQQENIFKFSVKAVYPLDVDQVLRSGFVESLLGRPGGGCDCCVNNRKQQDPLLDLAILKNHAAS